ncbi:MAG: polymer-forming cytoskeletal protein [Spirochaetales bacterium]|nr:polymer-forming cytoskeletal protein [Spirochaetales bacterium]MBP7264142.1 polymer-forming cytoskeletal protein [Spirochaetia bacterium]
MSRKSTIAKAVDITTVLGPTTSLSGTLSFESNLMIRGQFEGDIDAKGALYIDEGATVNAGRIRAVSIFVAGSVRGNLEAADKVELKPNAQIRGNVRAARLRIADGVIFEGRCEMIRSSDAFDPFAAKAGSGS